MTMQMMIIIIIIIILMNNNNNNNENDNDNENNYHVPDTNKNTFTTMYLRLCFLSFFERLNSTVLRSGFPINVWNKRQTKQSSCAFSYLF